MGGMEMRRVEVEGLIKLGVVREWRRGERDRTETWFKSKSDRAVALTGKPLPPQGVFCHTVLDIWPLYCMHLD